MPVSYLSLAQKARYAAFPEPLADDDLARHAYLNATDRAAIAALRADHTRLGYAVQLATVRCLGTFLDDPTAVPAELLSYLTQQLGLSSAGFAAAYSFCAGSSPVPGSVPSGPACSLTTPSAGSPAAKSSSPASPFSNAKLPTCASGPPCASTAP